MTIRKIGICKEPKTGALHGNVRHTGFAFL